MIVKIIFSPPPSLTIRQLETSIPKNGLICWWNGIYFNAGWRHTPISGYYTTIGRQRLMYFRSISWLSATTIGILWFTIKPTFWNSLPFLCRRSRLWKIGDLLLLEIRMGEVLLDLRLYRSKPNLGVYWEYSSTSTLVTGTLQLWDRDHLSSC